jgi:hypothetical protein
MCEMAGSTGRNNLVLPYVNPHLYTTIHLVDILAYGSYELGACGGVSVSILPRIMRVMVNEGSDRIN